MVLNISKTQFTVADFISWARSGELNLSPSFQRRSVWRAPAKSYLMDTIYRGLPTPIIFLRQITDTKTLSTVREVVDGQQRIRTLISFIDPRLLNDWRKDRDEFTVTKTHNAAIAKKTFGELDDAAKKRILDYQFSTHVLPTDTSDQQVLDIFRRMNATGTKLNPQELRNAAFFGGFIKSVYEIAGASLDLWRKWKTFTEDNIARMEEAEFVSEIFIMLMEGPSEKSQSLIDKNYRRYEEDFSAQIQVEKKTNALLVELDSAFGDAMANSPLSNRIILYGVLTALRNLSYAGVPVEKPASPKKISNLRRKLETLSVRLSEGNRAQLPAKVQDALLSRPGRKANRETLANYIEKGLVD